MPRPSKGVLPYHRRPKLYAEDDKLLLHVDPAEIIFGTSAFSADHQKFARIVKKALVDADLDFYWVNEFLEWAVGPGYKMIPLVKWGKAMKQRIPFKFGYDLEHASVYRTMRMLAEWWKAHHKPVSFLVSS